MTNNDIIFSLSDWHQYGYKFLDWCAINVGRKGVDWESGIEVTYNVELEGHYKYAMLRIYDEQLALMFHMKFPQYISSRSKEVFVKKLSKWTTIYD